VFLNEKFSLEIEWQIRVIVVAVIDNLIDTIFKLDK